MIKVISKHDFIRGFEEAGRSKQFTREGLEALYQYFTDLEEDLRTDLEFDPIAICCKYTEYENLEEFNEAYDRDMEDLEEIGEWTQVIEVDDDRFIILDY